MGSCKIFMGLSKIFLGSGTIFLGSGKIFLRWGDWESWLDKFHVYNQLRNWWNTFLLRDTASVYSSCNSKWLKYSRSHSLWFPSHRLFMDIVEDNLLIVDIHVQAIKDEDFIVADILVIVFCFICHNLHIKHHKLKIQWSLVCIIWSLSCFITNSTTGAKYVDFGHCLVYPLMF